MYVTIDRRVGLTDRRELERQMATNRRAFEGLSLIEQCGGESRETERLLADVEALMQAGMEAMYGDAIDRL